MAVTQEKTLAIWRNLTRLNHYFFTMAGKQPSSCPEIPLSMSQLKLLVTLTDHFPASMKLKELASELRITPGAVSQMVDILCHQGFLERRPDETDRRSIAISMSSEGQQELEHFHERVSTFLAPFLSAISDDKLSVFMEVLAALSEQTFQEPSQPEAEPPAQTVK